MISRFYSNEASLGSKLQILDVVNVAVSEMADIKPKDNKVPQEKSKSGEPTPGTETRAKTKIKAPRKLELMRNPEAAPQTNEFLKYACNFYYGLISRVADRTVSLSIFSETAESLLIKFVQTLTHILQAAGTVPTP